MCRSWCAALTFAPHSALACVHSTAFGRDVVPEVYCTLQGASGSMARRGRSALSANSASKLSLREGAFAGTPASCEVTAIQRRFLQLAATSSARDGWVMAATAPQWPAKYSISAAAERVLVVTAIAPSSTQANQASIASIQLSRWIRI